MAKNKTQTTTNGNLKLTQEEKMENTANNSVVIVDFVRTPFARASSVPTKAASLHDLLPEDKFEELKNYLTTAKKSAVVNDPAWSLLLTID